MFKSKSAALSVLWVLVTLYISIAEATPQRNRGKKNGGRETPQQKAAKTPSGIFAVDGNTFMLDETVQINGLPIRYRVSAPADQFTTNSGVQGAAAAPGTAGPMGINVLLHGDGGQSYIAFPNQLANGNLIAAAVLSPDPNLKWGGGSGGQRTEGVAHSQAVADLITQQLPNVIAFNQSQVFFTGVSGGALTLSGFFIPAHMGNFPNSGVLNCGAMAPQVDFTPEAAAAMANTRIHFQSTTRKLRSLQGPISQSVQAYEQAAANAGLGNQQINSLQTVDNSPNGGHCAFDGRDFTSGVQLMANSFENIMLPGGNGQVDGIGNVNKGVVGNERLQFAQGGR